jgi:hypothetical protein
LHFDNNVMANPQMLSDPKNLAAARASSNPKVKALGDAQFKQNQQDTLNLKQGEENITTRGQISVKRAEANIAAGAGGGSTGAALQEAPVNGVRQNYLKSLPNAAQVQQIGEGRQFSTRMFDGKEGKALAAQVATAYPDYDVAKAASYYKTRNDFDNGKEARQVNALNTALGHLDYANQALNRVGALGTLPGVSTVEKALGSQDANSLAIARKVMIEEVHNAWGVGAFTVDDRNSWEQEINAASPRELKQKMISLTQLLGTKMQNLQEQFDGSVPSSAVTPKQLLHNSARQSYKNVTGEDVPDVLQPRQSYAPQGGNQTQGGQPQNAAPKLANMQRNPQTGQQIGWNGTAWVDAKTNQPIGGR